MTLKRIGAGLLAVIICAICLELGERFEIHGRAQHRLNCRGYRRAPADADELCRRRAENGTTLCSRRLLLLGTGPRVRPCSGFHCFQTANSEVNFLGAATFCSLT
jgi:hypothetical protein